MMSLFTELITRVILIVAITNAIEFYLIITRRQGEITVPLAIGITTITIIPIVINIWYCLYRRGLI